MGTPFGFPDWQKQSPLDGPLLLDLNGSAQLPSNQTAMVYVGRWASCAGDVSTTAWPTVWTFSWYADQAGTKLLGRRVFVTDNNIAAPARFVFTNLGPWMRWSYSTASPGPTITQTAHLYGTNRRAVLPFEPGVPELIADNNVALGAATTAAVWTRGYYTGPAQLWATCTQTFSVVLRSYNDTLALVSLDEFQGLAANTDLHQQLILPAGAFRLEMTNTSGLASNYWMALTPSLTGA